MEIERKYLIREMPADLTGFSCMHLSQSYISRDPVIRIRRTEQEGKIRFRLTVKGEGLAVREEWEMDLTEAQYEGLLKKKEGRTIEKKRYRIPLGDGHVAELDIFEGEHEGLCLVEVEFSSRKDMEDFAAPDWFGTDVTEDLRYYNSTLSA